MTRSGCACNQSPAVSEIWELEPSDSPRDDEEPPSTRRDHPSRNLLSSPSAPTPDGSLDHFAEWDAPATIDAVANALAALGKVIRLEADDDFPAKLHAAHPDIAF